MIWRWQVMGKGHEAGNEAHSSSGLGHRPLKAEITGSNPVCATNHVFKDASSQMRSGLGRFVFSHYPRYVATM